MSAKKTEFSFKKMEYTGQVTYCPAPVAASVRKSSPRWVTMRIDKKTAKVMDIKIGQSLLTPFIDEENRALLFVSDQRPVPKTARRVYGKDGSLIIDLPRQGTLEKWFPIGPIRPMTLVEVSHGRLVITVPAV